LFWGYSLSTNSCYIWNSILYVCGHSSCLRQQAAPIGTCGIARNIPLGSPLLLDPQDIQVARLRETRGSQKVDLNDGILIPSCTGGYVPAAV
jgi:hypothetical protein